MYDWLQSTLTQAFDLGRVRILVATNAFGMGIDYPDVRLIAHFQTPGSLEAYYQEAGRAGRDDAPAYCHLYFGTSDLVTQRFMARNQKGGGRLAGRREALLAGIEAYARGQRCRQQLLCDYFGGGPTEPCGTCDICTNPDGVRAALEAYDDALSARRAEPSQASPRAPRLQSLPMAIGA